MCLFDQSEYNPVTKNLDKTPRQIMTEELMTEVLKKACKDPSDHLPYNALVSYIQTLTRRLSKSGFVRKNGKRTDPTTYYDEYMAVFGWTDPYKLKESTEEAQKTLTKAAENESSDIDVTNHVPFHRTMYMLGLPENDTGVPGSMDSIQVHVLGTCRSMCTS